MKQILFTLTLLMTTAVNAADQCMRNTEIVGAEYALSQIHNNEDAEQKHVMNLWRTKTQVAHEYLNNGITELWQKVSNGEVRLVRYFDHEQQAIEYQPGEVSYRNANNHWQQMQHMISDDLLTKMSLINKSGHGCDAVETYQLTTDTQNLTVEWMPKLQLMKSLLNVSGGVKTQWKLIELINDEQAITQEFAKREQYRATDYADIGDNESDPFLQKMIAMGYINHGPSGFYDADGHDIGDEHNHH
jgi:hypothetical protein